jgi:hypothetical protein
VSVGLDFERGPAVGNNPSINGHSFYLLKHLGAIKSLSERYKLLLIEGIERCAKIRGDYGQISISSVELKILEEREYKNKVFFENFFELESFSANVLVDDSVVYSSFYTNILLAFACTEIKNVVALAHSLDQSLRAVFEN